MNLDCPYQNWVKTLYCTLSNTFLKAFLIFQASGQWQLHYGNTVEITVFQLFDNLPLNIALRCWWIWIAHTKIEILHMSNTFLEALLKFQTSLQWQFSLWKILWKTLLLYCLTSFHWTLCKSVHEFE